MPAVRQYRWSWLFPPRRNRSVPWSGFEVFVVLLLIMFFWSSLLKIILRHSNFFGWVYGADFTKHLSEPTHSAEWSAAEYRVRMWLTVLSLPLNLATVIGVPALLRGAMPYQLGLSMHRFGRNIFLGACGALLVAPLQDFVIYLDSWYTQVLHVSPTEHQLTVVAKHALPVDRVLIFITAVVAAPLLEELLFRGFLQPWFIRRRAGGVLAVIFALGLALIVSYDQIDAALTTADWRGLMLSLQPAAFVLLLAPVLLLTRRMTRPEAAAGIFGTAVLFAAAHSSVWPSPVPLLPLGIVLGWLAYRTKSLVGPIVLHALFNTIACVEMYFLMFR
jgi:membrane protease YdiL (CAAX protease family)